MNFEQVLPLLKSGRTLKLKDGKCSFFIEPHQNKDKSFEYRMYCNSSFSELHFLTSIQIFF